MTTAFPTGLDSFTNPAASDPRNAPSHAAQHSDENDAIEALEAKVGVNGSAVASSLDKRIAALEASGGAPTGAIVAFGGSAAPTGWLLCDGSTISRTTYATLFGVVGIAFGAGDGSTTFKLPDLRGRVPLGKDNLGGTSANRATETQADNIGQAEGAEAPALLSHVHTIAPSVWTSGGPFTTFGSTSTSDTVTSTQAASNGDQTSGNLPPYQTVAYIIKT